MSRFAVVVEEFAGAQIHVLLDQVTGASARIWVGFGNNCLSLQLPIADGRLIRLIDDLEAGNQLRDFPSRFGNPILYPWPSKIPGGKYRVDGKDYQVKTLTPEGDAFHGLVKDRSWKVERNDGCASAAVLECAISTDDYPDMLESFPFPNRISVSHTLDESGLSIAATVTNIGNRLLPFGLGFHPYFKIPFCPDGVREDCTVTIRAQKQWDFPAIAERQPAISYPNPAAERRRLGTTDYNEGFTGLRINGGGMEARLTDPACGVSGVMRASEDFKSLVLFTPAARSAACLEPWTCTANAFNLAEAGIPDSGLLQLEPGASWTGWMKLTVEATGM